ncbi:CheA signal transduction histidine kinase [Desulfonatronospira thiodismutans ASO3-1]|uniref:Chemotaxis protein CheA n=1 Tax=Desulfonatronospira thiodismutans ASO3-1 TaxID=555779 RepID=D6SQT9_9BACT|nr:MULTISPECIES: chemotaxis protein CheA [Desulfonatronospira]EFI35115.1 CheA signal transduction histidine kinase [Desulfonatronospira thiodismutans ASO3-1]RQD76633.1 MAG: chemotaxis protein CheA [Desulfonatronospira sp. MSAO_Bac3]
MSQDFFDPEVYSDFVVEAREHLETIEPKLLELENNPGNLSLLNDIFRPMHSLKGASGFLGLKDMNALAHKGENILDELRQGRIQANSSIMDLILEATDALRTMVDNLESMGHEGSLEVGHIIEHIDEILKNKDEQASSGAPAQEVQKEEQDFSHPAAEQNYLLNMVSLDHLSDFIEEAQENLTAINSLLLEMEKGEGSSQDRINDLFRNFHNLKGNSGIIGYIELNALAHEVETFLNTIRSGEQVLDPEAVDVLLETVDVLESLLGNIDRETGEVQPESISGITSRIKELKKRFQVHQDEEDKAKDNGAREEAENIFAQAPADNEVAGQQQGDNDPEVDPQDLQIFRQTVDQQFSNMKHALDKLEKEGTDKELVDGLYRSLVTVQNSTGYMGFEELKNYASNTANLVDQGRKTDTDFSLMHGILKQEVDILESMINRHLSGLSSTVQDLPAQPSPEPDRETSAEKPSEASRVSSDPQEEAEPFAPAMDIPEQQQAQAASQAGESAEPSGAGKSADQGAGSEPQAKSQGSTTSTIRVDHGKLDELMNLIGELIINRNRFAMLSRSLEEGQDVMEVAQQLNETTNSMARISDDLQVTIMNVRMVPVRSVFTKFPRLVRDLSRKNNKNIQLITEGEETELDKSVVELIGDPLVHLIRNAVDHGLELPQERKDRGKEEKGTVWLRAAHKGNSVVIEIEDDGKGIDPEKMKAKAVEKGIIDREEARNMEEDQAVDLIFAPGFSTAETITDVSGRGVGMDVVKNNIKSLKGNISVTSAVGQGTRFSIALPLTLAIIDALMVKVNGQVYAIPLDAVSETTKIQAGRLNEINNRKVITLRGEVLGISDLAELLELPVDQADRDELPLVIIKVGDRRMGFIVEDLLERQEVVIKSLGEYLGDQPGISGATIMGDGSVVLILDPNEIYRIATSRS